jgi:glyoxylase-like metal-dependent hydrolase (beta-lactamase superfamily II)/rhodanese-related sulfurtransferase
MIEIVPIDTPSLGNRSYLATDGSVAVVIDPQRDIDRVLAEAAGRDVRITHVAETHIHNDYVTGGLALARTVGAEYLVNGDDAVVFDRTPVRDGDVIASGELRLRVVNTPGHTFTHLAYVLLDRTGEVVGVFTGGSLLFGSTGRPDLLGVEHAETLARHQHASAHRLARELPGHARVFPTHGFGSFCSATQSGGVASTIAAEAKVNPALTRDEHAYVAGLLAGLGEYPAYYAHMGPANAAGPGPADLSPPPVADPGELRRRLEAGEWVVDLRDRRAFAAGHLAGTLNFGLNNSFATYLGWLIPWGTPATLLAGTADQVAAAQRDLVRLGIDRPAAMATGGVEQWGDGRPPASFRRATFADLAAESHVEGRQVPYALDVRRDDERAAGHLAGTAHIPLHRLAGRLDEVPRDRPVWVHCAIGYRAAIAASLLERAGHDVILIDDDFAKASAAADAGPSEARGLLTSRTGS